MKLENLLKPLEDYKIFGPSNIEVSSLLADSRDSKRGGLFVAVAGLTVDGHQFIPDAISRGVTVVVGEKKPRKTWLDKVTYIKVPNSRRALGLLASAWCGYPSRKLKVIGVTGTDGKTTTATLIYWILKEAGKKAGLISTVSAKIGEKEFETGLHVTNPEPLKLQEFLAKMVQKKCEYVVLEVTSHGLDQERVAGIKFDVGVLTNITHEHLDYHKSWQAYRRAKARLFGEVSLAVLNKDDKSFNYISRFVSKKGKIVSYALKKAADLNLEDVVLSGKTKLLAEYNLENALAAVVVARELGVSEKDIKTALSSFKLPTGRLEKINEGQDFDVYIDFAHTPNALEKVLSHLKKETKGRIITVFGSAGERDKEKRFLMGEVAARLADVSIFTAEDPRTEDIHEILDQMAQGAKKAGGVFVRIPLRGEAIVYGLSIARKGDTVVIAGKWHEKSMSYDGVEHPWSDKIITRDALRGKGDMAAIILAAGKGTRMKSQTQKVLRKVAGRSMIAYALQNLRGALFKRMVIVIGHKKEEVMKETRGTVLFAEQKKVLGTGHAAATGLKKVPKNIKTVIVLNGDDSAFYKNETIKDVIKTHIQKKAVVTFVSLMKENPKGLGRVIRDKKGNLEAVVEEKEATVGQKKVKEVNDGLYVFDRIWLSRNLSKIKKSKAGEYYIGDLIKIALRQGRNVEVYKLKDVSQWQGVNNQKELEEADGKMKRILADALA
jgi:UDP-N-acetylmuramoyl-L-alanyl-D-glutamate--2,6-diaminopimelate ligase